MGDIMDLSVFREKLINNGLKEAIEFKNSFVPNSLYKYVQLLDERYVNYKEKNEEKFESLKDNEIWISHYTKFNDPFEFKMMTIDKEKLKGTQWKTEDIENCLGLFRNFAFTSCFSSDGNNMPMWAHYANNHKGFCVKYSVISANNIFPVLYEPARTKSSVIVTNIITEMYKSIEQGLEEPTQKFYEYFTYFYLSFSCKNNFWEYEKEYRLLYPNISFKQDGKLIELSDAGLKIDSIYIGYMCDEEYVNKIINIGKYIGCEVYKMDFDEYNDKFCLITKRLKYK